MREQLTPVEDDPLIFSVPGLNRRQLYGLQYAHHRSAQRAGWLEETLGLSAKGDANATPSWPWVITPRAALRSLVPVLALRHLDCSHHKGLGLCLELDLRDSCQNQSFGNPPRPIRRTF